MPRGTACRHALHAGRRHQSGHPHRRPARQLSPPRRAADLRHAISKVSSLVRILQGSSARTAAAAAAAAGSSKQRLGGRPGACRWLTKLETVAGAAPAKQVLLQARFCCSLCTTTRGSTRATLTSTACCPQLALTHATGAAGWSGVALVCAALILTAAGRAAALTGLACSPAWPSAARLATGASRATAALALSGALIAIACCPTAALPLASAALLTVLAASW